MKRTTIAGGAFATVLGLLALAAGYRILNQDAAPPSATSPAIKPSTRPPAARDSSVVGEPPGVPLRPDRRPPTGRPTRGGCAGGAASRRRCRATTSTAPSMRTPGSPTCRRSGCPKSATRSRFSGSRSPTGSSDRSPPAFPGALWRDRAHRGARPRGAGDSQERDRVRPRPLRIQRLRRRRAGVGRQARRRRPRQSADPRHRAPSRPLDRRRPLPAARYGARAAGRLHRFYRVGPGRSSAPTSSTATPTRVSSACVSTPSAPSRAARVTAPGDAARRPRDRALRHPRSWPRQPRDLRRRSALRPGW